MLELQESAIVVIGFARGGTNILSNILQSSPEVVSVRGEINQTLGERSAFNAFDRWRMRNIKAWWIPGRDRLVTRSRQIMDNRKLLNLEHEGYKFSHETRLYTKAEVVSASTLYKGVIYTSLNDLAYYAFIQRMYAHTKMVFLTRDGLSLCEGWMRRGITASECGAVYQRCFNDLQQLQRSGVEIEFVKFEDLLEQPFETGQRLFSWLGLKVTELEKLRLNIKKSLNQSGEHTTRLGMERQLVWLDRSNIYQLLDRDINSIQADQLKASDKNAFMREARSAMEGFGYFPQAAITQPG